MTGIRHTPGLPLSRFVQCFWLFENYVPQHSKERLLPDASLSIVFDLANQPSHIYDLSGKPCHAIRNGVVCGPHSQGFVIDAACQEQVLGITFYAGGAAPFLRLPLGELHNEHASLPELCGASAHQLSEQLADAKPPALKFRLLEQFLLALGKDHWHRNDGLTFARRGFQAEQPFSVGAIAKDLGWSPKRLIERFRAEVGIAPKLFCRIQRFQRLIRRIATDAPCEWTKAALDCGYYDQAHLIHDFREFTGLTPAAYARLELRHPNHLPLPKIEKL